jgi:hypothetical protein
MFRAAIEDDVEPAAVIVLGAFAAPMLVGSVVMVLSHTVYDWTRAARVIADSGLCACCASDLRGKTPGDDGLIQCTECGAAWRPASPVAS